MIVEAMGIGIDAIRSAGFDKVTTRPPWSVRMIGSARETFGVHIAAIMMRPLIDIGSWAKGRTFLEFAN